MLPESHSSISIFIAISGRVLSFLSGFDAPVTLDKAKQIGKQTNPGKEMETNQWTKDCKGEKSSHKEWRALAERVL